MTTDFGWLPFLTINSSRMCGIRQTGYCSTMVVSTQARDMSTIQIYLISYIPYLTLAMTHGTLSCRTS